MSQLNKTNIQNPIISGFNPDPSILRVDDDYYIATSTFEYYPAIGIHHSRDLQHWQLIGHVFADARSLDLRGVPNSGGVWAPSLSYSDGLFYMVYTNVLTRTGPFKDLYNYVVTAESITGPWSKPIFLNSSGFDPSLFHDNDGRKWIVNVQWDPRPDYPSFAGIILQEYDAQQKQLVGPVHTILQRDHLIEGPNLYKIDSTYYLMVAQNGTGWEHGIRMTRSQTISGPYELDPQDDILTSRDNPDLLLQKAGHGELVQTQKGDWFLAHLASRPVGSHRRCILGRETCLQPCIWTEDGWLRLTSGTTDPSVIVTGPDLREHCFEPEPARDDFDNDCLSFHWTSLRQPVHKNWLSLTERSGWLRLYGRESLHSMFSQSLLVRRLQHFEVTLETCLDFLPRHTNQRAGLICWYDTDNHFYLYVTHNSEQGRALGIALTDDGNYEELRDHEILLDSDAPVYLQVHINHEIVQFVYSLDGQQWQNIGPVLDMTILSDDYANKLKFTGAMVGLCAQDLQGTGLPADFDYFELRS